MDRIEVKFHDDERTVTLTVDERVFADRTCGQWESGWVAFDGAEDEYFISDSGIVYNLGTPDEVGVAPEMVIEADKREAELDKIYAEGGM